jgi:hypothetical protein
VGIFLSIILTILLWAAYAVSGIPLFRALDSGSDRRNPVLVVFGWVWYGLTCFAAAVTFTVLVWVTVGGVTDDHAKVGDVRCQRYVAYFNGKTESTEWRTIDCVQVSR